MLRRAAEEPVAECSSAIILCDIDRFKGINDQNGHDVGDRVVLTVAAILKKNTRNLDTVIRWGGDEFLIVVPRIGAPALAELAERLRARVAAAVLYDDGQVAIPLSLSIGVAAQADGETLDGWVKRADEALYLAKAAGRNRCVFAPDVAASSCFSGGT
jgi:diguanylate cyclase (GGDEF)-like protein